MLQWGIFNRFQPITDWKTSPVTAPRYIPEQRAHNGNWMLPIWNDLSLIR